MYEMEECIENEERYGEMISRLEKMADKIEERAKEELTDMYGRELTVICLRKLWKKQMGYWKEKRLQGQRK